MPRSSIFVILGILMVTAVAGVLLVKLRNTPRTPTANAPSPSNTSTAPASQPKPAASQTLLLYCAAGIKNPVLKIASDYEKEFGIRVEIQFGGSGTLLSNVRLAGRGDLFLPADGSYIDLARKDNMIDEVIPLASMTPVIAVKKGNPKQLAGVADLSRPGLRIALANPGAASIGQAGKSLLLKAGIWNEIEAAANNRGVFKPTVNDIANDVRLGTVDAAIVWDATVMQKEYAGELDALPIVGAEAFAVETPIAVLKSSKNPTAALHFARYMSAVDRGLKTFQAEGFITVPGDVWEDQPTLLIFSGAVNRTGIKDAIAAFEQRENVKITTVYNGCGLLNGQIKLGERPDAYYTCDASFMDPVAEHFGKYEVLTETDIVMLVAKDNPHQIKTLADLAKPGLKLGLANEIQSTLGTLTARMLKARGLYESVQKNVLATAPTADLLVNQIRVGSLDAVIVYRANTLFVLDHLMTIPIDDPMATAAQSIAIGKNSKHRRLAERFSAFIHQPQVLDHLEKSGFRLVNKSAPTTAPR